ncbi:MAG: hypothetical protein MJ230_03270 [bacterium]|nr:hypothetical protein [bacterium]
MIRVDGSSNMPQSSSSGKTPESKEYWKKTMEYKSHIKEQAENLDDLKNAAYWKQQQINLAKEYNDFESAKKLQQELDRINEDISRNTSVFK